ncbi:hypothetical protein Pla163_25350 [Planctomycetes bacterium Pla163]|uniref:Uncharacterized protein n=1 Tax=Rohdeia mirabilis TaxID=2528008 RepID=A0A518D1P5_9BACT|nr:hypothetical protein Pla163_25350 [Planctomycetes bacterium Pla163]
MNSEALAPADFDQLQYVGRILLVWVVFVAGTGVVLVWKPGPRWDVLLLVVGTLLQALFVAVCLQPWTWTAEHLADPRPWIFACAGTGIVVMNALQWSLRCPRCGTRGIRLGIEDGLFRAARRKSRGPCHRCTASIANGESERAAADGGSTSR